MHHQHAELSFTRAGLGVRSELLHAWSRELAGFGPVWLWRWWGLLLRVMACGVAALLARHCLMRAATVSSVPVVMGRVPALTGAMWLGQWRGGDSVFGSGLGETV